MIRLGIVGAGLIWQKKHRAIIEGLSDRFTVAAFSSRTSETRERAGREFPRAALYGDYRELCAADDLDAVVVLTPIELNAPVTEAALEAGKVAIVEKPLAASREELARIVTAVGSRPERLFILEQAVHGPMVAVMRRAIGEGAIGEPVQFERSVTIAMTDSPDDGTGGYGSTSWRMNPQFPIGMVFDGGIHDLAEQQWIFGPPESVAARGESLREGYGRYDLVTFSLRYRSGVHGVYTHSSLLPRIANTFVVRGREGALVFADGSLTAIDKGGARQPIDLAPSQEHEVMWREIADCIDAGSAAGYDLDATTRDLDLLFAAERALESGCTEPAG